jgi:aerobic-type carbon monoxide dehydrogenase small subunit (CoxS/CutS family)
MIAFRLNGADMRVDAPDDAPLLSVLSHDLASNGVHFGCGRAQCGSCAVLLDGDPVRSCVLPVSAVAGKSVTTLAGLRAPDGKPGRLQQAFIDEQAAQCGYCAAGMIVQAHALLERNPNPNDAEVRNALNGNLCRCGAHNRIVRAVLRAAQAG